MSCDQKGKGTAVIRHYKGQVFDFERNPLLFLAPVYL
jgi:hypothetical protein